MAIILPQRDISTGKAMYDVDSGLMMATGAEPGEYDCGIFTPGQAPAAYRLTIYDVEDGGCFVRGPCTSQWEPWPCSPSNTYYRIYGLRNFLHATTWTLSPYEPSLPQCQWVYRLPMLYNQSVYYRGWFADYDRDTDTWTYPTGCGTTSTTETWYARQLYITITAQPADGGFSMLQISVRLEFWPTGVDYSSSKSKWWQWISRTIFGAPPVAKTFANGSYSYDEQIGSFDARYVGWSTDNIASRAHASLVAL